MCSHYEAPLPQLVADMFGVDLYEQGTLDLFPSRMGPFICQTEKVNLDGEFPLPLEVLSGSFGIIPFWSETHKIARYTYNCRCESAIQKPIFRNAWQEARHCIIPAAAIYEPDWRSGKAISTRIVQTDGELMGIAGLWEHWYEPGTGRALYSYSMLTINADNHPFMRNYQKPLDEKRMVVILPKESYRDWLDASAGDSMAFMYQYPAERLTVAM